MNKIQIGDTLIEWSYNFNGKEKRFTEHVVQRITPSGRIRTDLGLELYPDLTILRPKSRGVYVSLPTEELKKEMLHQQYLGEAISYFDNYRDIVYYLNTEELIEFINQFKKINHRLEDVR